MEAQTKGKQFVSQQTMVNAQHKQWTDDVHKEFREKPDKSMVMKEVENFSFADTLSFDSLLDKIIVDSSKDRTCDLVAGFAIVRCTIVLRDRT